MRPPGQKQYLIRHTVEQGDTLYSIAWRYGQDYREVAAWNHIDAPYTIYEGEELLIIPPNRYSGPRERREPPPAPVATTAPARHWPTRGSRSVEEPAPKTSSHGSSSTPAASRSHARARPRPAPAHVASNIDWAWPTRGKVTSRFAVTSGKKGVEISGDAGQAIRAAAPGDVVYSGNGLIGYGNLIIIKHDEHYLSAYGHNKKLLVKEGDKVKRGQKIAIMGQTPGSGSILYFEIRRGGKPVDPLKYLPSRTL
jgi:lipoprotein NlpD